MKRQVKEMKITLLNIQEPGDNKDYNGGFGTTWQIGSSFLSRILQKMRSKGEYFPIVSYGYLASILKQNGHKVEFLENEIPKNSDLILLHASPIRHKKEMEFLKKIKETTNAHIGIVGPFASVKPELFEKLSDFIIQGEPEEVISTIKDGELPKGIVKSEPVKDLDTLPFPDWSIFPVDKFCQKHIMNKTPFLIILSSRGCLYNCPYCPYKVFGLWRVRDPIKVVDEIEYLQKNYGVKSLMFRDPMFSLEPEITKTMANEIIKRGIKIEWGCETRLDKLDENFLDLLYESGLRAIKVGIESTNHDILKRAGRKPIDADHTERIVKYCDRKGIKVVAFYILGLPDDTKESIESTIKYAKGLNTDFANFTICTPIPGTKFFEEMKDSLTTDNWEDYDNFHVVFKHKNLTKEQLLKLQEKAIVGYYFRLRYILKHIWRRMTR